MTPLGWLGLKPQHKQTVMAFSEGGFFNNSNSSFYFSRSLIGWRKFYTWIKMQCRNVQSFFLPPYKKINIFGNICIILLSEVEIIRNELLFLWIFSMCKLRWISQLSIKPFMMSLYLRWGGHIDFGADPVTLESHLLVCIISFVPVVGCLANLQRYLIGT